MGKRVLVVEDDALLGLDLVEQIEGEGYHVIGLAHSNDEAFTLLSLSECDVAVLDVNLGRETSEPIAQTLHERGTPFVVLSGASRAVLPDHLSTAPFVSKPVVSEVLFRKLADLLVRN